MNKTTAHIILGGIDIAALGACYYVFSEYHAVEYQLATGVGSFFIQRPLGLYLLIVVAPIVHTVSFFDRLTQTKKWVNYALIIVFLIIVSIGIIVDIRLEARILESGYYYCPSKSQTMRLSEFKAYLRKDLPCLE